jgi:hypothetical protein
MAAVGPPPGPGPHALRYQSEWARALTPVDIAILNANQIDPMQMNWWGDVAHATIADTALPTVGHLDPAGWVIHARPVDVMRWINELTWKHEWLKYRVTDATGNAVPCPPRPPSRRV